MKKIDKRKIIRIVLRVAVCCLLLFLILWNVPWRTRVDLEMVCTEVAQDGTVVQTGAFTLKGWELKYLFEKNHLLDVESLILPDIPPLKVQQKCYLTLSKIVLPQEDHPDAVFGWLFDDNIVAHSLFISLEEDLKTCLIRVDGKRYFACSLDADFSVADILETHKWILD